MRTLLRWFIPLIACGAMAFLFNTAMVTAQEAPATQPATQPTGSIKVTVTGEDGKPASGITLTVSARGGRGRGRRGGGGGGGRRGRGTPIATGTTDDMGVATLSNIPVAAAPYTVAAANADRSLVGRGTASVTADAPAAEVSIQLGAPPAGRGGGGGGAPPPPPAPPAN